jgi:hypothetical protein
MPYAMRVAQELIGELAKSRHIAYVEASTGYAAHRDEVL